MVYILLVSFFLSFLITEVAVTYCHFPTWKYALFLPSLIVSSLLAILLVNLFGIQKIEMLKVTTFFIFFGAIFIYIIGLLYDFRHIKLHHKLIVQLLASLCFPLVGLHFNDLHGLLSFNMLPTWGWYLLTICVVMLIVCVLSAMDDIEDVAAGFSILTLAAYTIYFFFYGRPIFCVISAALLGSMIALGKPTPFDKFRNHIGNNLDKQGKAMSASGYLILGFSLSYLALKASMNTSLNPDPDGKGFALTLALFFLPCFDLLRLIVVKLFNSENILKHHHAMLCHLLRDRCTSHILLCAILAGSYILFCTIHLLMFHYGASLTIILLTDIALYALAWTVIITQPIRIRNQEQLLQVNPEIESLPRNTIPYTRPNLSDGNIKISIIVAAYNSGATLSDTLESILAQTYTNYEVVLCDGLSSDNTMDIVARYQEQFGERLKAVSETDKGIYDAMNKGIERATGDIIGILNSDDYYTSNDILDNIVLAFKQTSLLEAVYGDVHYVHPSNLQRPVRYYSSRHFHPILMRCGFMPAHPSFYCLKQLYSTYGKYRLEYKVAADFDQLFRLIFICRIRTQYINKDFVTMRTGGASTSGLKSHIQIMRDHTRSMHSYGVSVHYPLIAFRYLYKCGSILWSGVKYQVLNSSILFHKSFQ